MYPGEGRRCEVDDAYVFSYSDEPSIGSLMPTLCSNPSAFLVHIRPRPGSANPDPRPPRAFHLCGTHRAIVLAFDRTISRDGGTPRVVRVVNLG